MDMPMDKPMDDKDSKFKCPSCGEMLSVESASDDKSEGMPSDKPMEKPMDKPMGADKMPMDKLKNVLMSAKPKPEPQGY